MSIKISQCSSRCLRKRFDFQVERAMNCSLTAGHLPPRKNSTARHPNPAQPLVQKILPSFLSPVQSSPFITTGSYRSQWAAAKWKLPNCLAGTYVTTFGGTSCDWGERGGVSKCCSVPTYVYFYLSKAFPFQGGLAQPGWRHFESISVDSLGGGWEGDPSEKGFLVLGFCDGWGLRGEAEPKHPAFWSFVTQVKKRGNAGTKNILLYRGTQEGSVGEWKRRQSMGSMSSQSTAGQKRWMPGGDQTVTEVVAEVNVEQQDKTTMASATPGCSKTPSGRQTKPPLQVVRVSESVVTKSTPKSQVHQLQFSTTGTEVAGTTINLGLLPGLHAKFHEHLYIYIYLEVPKCSRESTKTTKLR
ncbi:hypothetical protein GE21DRAFT_1355874 [Neurospora crassa]|nr:hypothetical protein GE21DRAFT_1355874 [Neurospora crassa]